VEGGISQKSPGSDIYQEKGIRKGGHGEASRASLSSYVLGGSVEGRTKKGLRLTVTEDTCHDPLLEKML